MAKESEKLEALAKDVVKSESSLAALSGSIAAQNVPLEYTQDELEEKLREKTSSVPTDRTFRTDKTICENIPFICTYHGRICHIGGKGWQNRGRKQLQGHII